VNFIGRRRFIAATSALLLSRLASAQKAGRIPALGSLSTYPEPPPGRVRATVMNKVMQLGWREDTVRIERAYGNGDPARLPELVDALLKKNVDVIWAVDADAAVAAARATKTVPIVFFGVAFAVEQGLAESLARPGRNATGVSFYPSTELVGKKIEILSQVVPRARRIALLVSEDAAPTVSGTGYTQPYASVDAAARKLKVELTTHVLHSASELDAVFAAIVKSKAQAIATVGTMLLWRERQRIVDFANGRKLPSAFGLDEFAEAGGLLSYGPVWTDMLAHTFDYVDKIFKGAKPAELPIEQPTKYELVLNKRTADAIGVRFAHSMLVRADRVIE
jgi:putative ABC transport system substrate-binding protein